MAGWINVCQNVVNTVETPSWQSGVIKNIVVYTAAKWGILAWTKHHAKQIANEYTILDVIQWWMDIRLICVAMVSIQTRNVRLVKVQEIHLLQIVNWVAKPIKNDLSKLLMIKTSKYISTYQTICLWGIYVYNSSHRETFSSTAYWFSLAFFNFRIGSVSLRINFCIDFVNPGHLLQNPLTQ